MNLANRVLKLETHIAVDDEQWHPRVVIMSNVQEEEIFGDIKTQIKSQMGRDLVELTIPDTCDMPDDEEISKFIDEVNNEHN